MRGGVDVLSRVALRFARIDIAAPRRVAMFVFTLVAAFVPSSAFGGECTDGDDAYLEVLEGRRTLPYHGYFGAASCLECDFDVGTNRWSGSLAAEALRGCRASPIRARVAAALDRYVKLDASNDSLAAMRDRAAVTLASYGFTSADSVDIYEIIAARIATDPNGLAFNLPLLAAMDDPRTLPFVTAAYDSLRGGSLRRNREKLIAIMNCVYHLSDAGAVRFAEQVMRTESDSLLVERAALIVNRPPIVAAPKPPLVGEQIIPLDVTGVRPTAQLTAGDQPPVSMIFDTGAGGTIINTAFAKSLALESRGAIDVGSPGGANPVKGFFATIPSARLGEAVLKDVTVIVVDLPLPLEGVSGVMSPNAFVGSLVRFELANARVVVVPKSPETIPSVASHPYSSGGHPLPAIVIDFAGVELDAHIDTGSSRGLSMPIESAKRLKLKSPLTPTAPIRRAGGEHNAFTAEVAGDVRIGPLTLTDPLVTFIEGVPIGNIGFSVIKDLLIVLDPAEKRSWLLKAE
ncbi:MAG: pepsin/retropepsin-like aspartic protease family protein [bacterium]